jgi:hypothetical protein
MAESFVEEEILIEGPRFHVDLAALDACHPVHYSRRLLIFQCNSSTDRYTQLSALKAGLKQLILLCPTLGGIVAPLPTDATLDGRPEWRTILPGKGIELIVKDLRSSIVSYRDLEDAGFQSSKLPYKLLVPIPQDIDNSRPYAACKVQFSAIEGGTIVTFSMSHSVADGSGTNEMLRILSEHTRRAQAQQDKVVEETNSPASKQAVDQDRNLLRDMTSKLEFNIDDHPAYMWHPTPPGNHPFKALSPEVPAIMHISTSKLAQLKADATLTGSPTISTHDALAGLMWRSMLLIRSRRSTSAQDLPRPSIGSIFMPSDARRHVNLPQSYIGNAVYQLTASLNLDILFSSSGLQHAAAAIRHAITAVTPELVRSLLAMTNERWIPWRFIESASTTGLAMGTDWTSGDLYKLDWGPAFGSMVRYRYPDEAFSCILPKLPDGSAEVMMGVIPDEIETLRGKECFGNYL